ncbi:MAG TPA: hypothetical protein VMI30_05595 [Stellaceae bacterium]|nr:hypothetical protein [Stellaceae bacterium]
MTRLPVACVALALVAAPAQAQQQMNMPMKGMPGMNMDETKSGAAYHPGLGDLMITLVQPHHIKLGLAGAARNWPLAAYELDELQETFDTVGKLIVKHGSLQIAPTIAATVRPAMEPLDKAIAAKDGAAFAKAYAALTDACNACHRSADHSMIMIKVPDGANTAFPDQEFAPAK